MKRGDIVADYIIKEICGQGLFKARRIHEESFVTLMELPGNISQDDNRLEHFSTIRHANVQEILAVFDIDGTRYLTTPWIEVVPGGLAGVSLDGVGEQWLQQLLSGLIYLKKNRYSLPPAEPQSIVRTSEGKCYISIIALLSQNGKGGSEADWINYFVERLKQLTGRAEKNAYSDALKEIAGMRYDSLTNFSKSLGNTTSRRQTEDLKSGWESDNNCGEESEVAKLNVKIAELQATNELLNRQNEELRKKSQPGDETLCKEKLDLQREVTQLKKALSQEKRVYSSMKMVLALVVGGVCCWWFFGQKSSRMDAMPHPIATPINPVEEVKIVKQLCEESGKPLEELADYVRGLREMAAANKPDETSSMLGELQTELDEANGDLSKARQALNTANANLKQAEVNFASSQEEWEVKYNGLRDEYNKLQGEYNQSLDILSKLKGVTGAQAEDYSDLYTKVRALINSNLSKPILTPRERKRLEGESIQIQSLLNRINAWKKEIGKGGRSEEEAEKINEETQDLLKTLKLGPMEINGIDDKMEELKNRQKEIGKMLES